MKSIIIAGITLIILSSVGYFFFFSPKQNIIPVDVKTDPIQSGKFVASTSAKGKLIARKKDQLVVMFAGIVYDEGKSIGQFIKSGTAIAAVRLPGPELHKKEQELEYAILDLQILEEQIGQNESLFKAKAVSEMELKELKIRKYKQDKYIEELRNEIKDDMIRTSFDGLLIEKSFHNGDQVASGTIIAIIVDTSSYAVEILAEQHQIPFIHIGQNVQFVSETFQGIKTGEVLEIGRSAENSQSNQFSIGEAEPEFKVLASIRINPSEKIFIGSLVEARFILQEKAKTLFIPGEAILFRNDTTIVFIDSCGTAKRRKVETGLSNDQFIEILSGLLPKDTVITTNVLEIQEGMRVSNKRSNKEFDKK